MVEHASDEDRVPLVLGGDHSVAMGTVAGMSRHFRKRGEEMGLIWVDAHRRTIAGLRINTACSDGTHTLGDPDRTGTTWRIFVMRDNSPNLELEEIAIVWY